MCQIVIQWYTPWNELTFGGLNKTKELKFGRLGKTATQCHKHPEFPGKIPPCNF